MQTERQPATLPESRNRKLSRRMAMVRAGSAWVACAFGPSQLQADPQDSGGDWIDAHTHVWTPDTENYRLDEAFRIDDMQPKSFTPEQFWRHADPCGVRRVVLIQMSYYGYDNGYMLDVIRRDPKRYVGVAVVDERAQPTEKMRQLATQGVTGFRIRPTDFRGENTIDPDRWLDTAAMRSMWACGADERLSMCHLINPNYLPAVARMCRQYPRTPVVIDHFARIGIDGRIRVKDLDQLCRLADHPEVTVKLSAYYALGAKRPPYHDLAPMIRRLRDAFGAERLMWASDCPFQIQGEHSFAASIDLIHQLDFLDATEKRAILRDTAARVFFRG